ncbi:MAG: hypothetical protein QXW52_03195 [Candidatus Caldarchaeum sp.]
MPVGRLLGGGSIGWGGSSIPCVIPGGFETVGKRLGEITAVYASRGRSMLSSGWS